MNSARHAVSVRNAPVSDDVTIAAPVAFTPRKLMHEWVERMTHAEPSVPRCSSNADVIC